ncbi:cytochrome P450 [Amycolatopsis mediterranei S699]|uniref:Cytochrome P450 n=3 Tax=Amycolatopsis mediterranei TaxID=33910 RepID=A0A0H3D6Z2_AMYMU|nr:cytochrome P450 [Amycolatopsis mediterranei]ADJ45259.1 cytochrome P450 [Amycolatopsis mediterranei U32]AEK42019.1 cytochrome P450 [Amycolatopsis mediterranei S699]AFO76970.1 cytochrome P450 [Amycolatopsis mediterranei S699]AGT84098.1 cytochrome P450 [Amycolatopsis mediterranei RB]KDO08544.1 cytochrome P450 [Amycolatopsis mediterranei]
MTTTAEIPEFPMPRAAGCPFDPPPAARALQEQAPLARVRLWDGSTPWLVTRYADQRALLADPRVSADVTRPGYPSPAPLPKGGTGIGFILMDNPEHARLRKMVTAPFTIRRVAAMRPAVQKIVDDLIDELLAGPKPVDLVEAFALPVPSLVICELLGVPYADHGFFQDNSKVIIRRDARPEERAAGHQALIGYLDRLVGEKLEHPADDVLSGLATRVAAGELTRVEAAQMGVLLLIAGHETTANMIALGTLALLEHPDQLALLRESDDPALVASAVEELLRYLNITHNGRRRVALEDIEIAGETVRAGEGLIMANDIANRDPEIFPGGDRLDLTRDAHRHVAFGFGVHQCLGQPLARLELQVVYSTLYRRIPTLAPATEIGKIPFKHDGSVYGVYELPVTW